MNRIICGDAAIELEKLDAESVDLVVTSPPYDNLRSYNGYTFDFDMIAWHLERVLKTGGVIVWVVGDATIKGSETGTSFKQALHFKELGLNLHDTMIYQKDNPPPVGGANRYYQHFEYMFVLSKGKPKTFNPIKSERRNKWNDKRTTRIKAFNRNKNGEFTKKQVLLTGDVKIGNIWKYIVGGGNSVEYGMKHPAAFPEKLVYDHIISWSNPGDLVLDPFNGSGTTTKVARDLSREYIGIDISQEYCDIANQRLDKPLSDNKETIQ